MGFAISGAFARDRANPSEISLNDMYTKRPRNRCLTFDPGGNINCYNPLDWFMCQYFFKDILTVLVQRKGESPFEI